MTPEFANLVNPTFQYVLDLVNRIKHGEPVELETERAQIRSELEDSEMTAASERHPVKVEDFRLAKQGLVYWIDELVTNADPTWQRMTLEWEYFESNDRAWKFYVDGEQRALKSTPDVIEVWYLAMVLGFEGDIRNAFDEHLNAPLDVDSTGEQERKRWAAKLEKQIRQHKLPSLSETSLQGDVRVLSGTSQLKTASGWVAVLFVVLLILVIVLSIRN